MKIVLLSTTNFAVLGCAVGHGNVLIVMGGKYGQEGYRCAAHIAKVFVRAILFLQCIQYSF